jgi:membrane-associated protease RseP (regulator of RpoE activity)
MPLPEYQEQSTEPVPPREFVPPVTPDTSVRPERRTKYLVLFVLTLLTTTFAGALWHRGFLLGNGGPAPPFWSVASLAPGLWYSVGVMAILGAHEMGHYVACRYYGVDASLPYFLPVPPPFFTGTLGAVIRIRQPIRTKRALFDIGIAGPIAGFLVAVPTLFIGVHLSNLRNIPQDLQGPITEFGEPLLFRIAQHLKFGVVPDGEYVNLHPLGFAAWFGMLATTLNLFPIGQLDGGHISYAILGRKSTLLSIGTVLCLMGLTSFVSLSWVVWTTMTVGMLIVFGPHHPRTNDEHEPLDSGRMALALFAIVMFMLCFTASPIETRDMFR